MNTTATVVTATDPMDVIDEDAGQEHIIRGPVSDMRTLSGIQPSGQLHLGNYFGAIAQHLDAQTRNEAYFFIASYHAMTSARRGSDLRKSTRDVALDYLALGIDPMRAALYRQTDVAGVTQLAWILNCLCSVGDLERSVSYKAKVAKGLGANAGLFTYPVLMAADILIVNAQVVPVGQDQIQNIELARRLAARFNEAYEQEVFLLPKAQCNDCATLPGKDGAKMSKSYGNTIPIFCTPGEYRAHALGIVTDSVSLAAVKDPTTCNAFGLLKFLAAPAEMADWEQRYLAGGLAYSDVKKRIGDLLEKRFGAARERRAELAAHPDDVEDILRDGAQRANQTAEPVLAQVFDVTGLGSRAAFMPVNGPVFARSTTGWA